MKPTNRITPFPRMISFLLAAAMLLCLASCGAPADSSPRPDADAYNKYEAYIPRDANGNIIPYVPTNKDTP